MTRTAVCTCGRLLEHPDIQGPDGNLEADFKRLNNIEDQELLQYVKVLVDCECGREALVQVWP